MRTTLNIDTELLVAAKELAERERKTARQVVSELLRQALRVRATLRQTSSGRDIHGFLPVASRGGVVTDHYVNQLRDELGD